MQHVDMKALHLYKSFQLQLQVLTTGGLLVSVSGPVHYAAQQRKWTPTPAAGFIQQNCTKTLAASFHSSLSLRHRNWTAAESDGESEGVHVEPQSSS